MNIEIEQFRQDLCRVFCQEIAVRTEGDWIAIGLPIVGRDGDHFNAYVRRATGGWEISDRGSTLMRLSYEFDLARLLAGAREKLYAAVLAESGLLEVDGEISLKVAPDDLNRGIFTLAQGVARIEDVALWTRQRVESTFFDDLRSTLIEIVGSHRLAEDVIPPVADGASYLVDFEVRETHRPLYVFGVNSKDRARLATITLQHIRHAGPKFDSIVVCEDIDDLPSLDVRHLLVAANDVVPTIADSAALRDKIENRLAA